jgi:hypothetical protein
VISLTKFYSEYHFSPHSAKNDTHSTYAIKDLLPLAGSFFARGRKKNLQKKRSTMLPQAKAVGCINPISILFHQQGEKE